MYPLAAARALCLHTQGLSAPLGAGPTPTLDDLYAVVARLGCVQIDTLQMVQRSHYLALWSRLGRYNPADFDRLIYDPAARRLFEGWQHAACIVPLTDYRYQMPRQRRLREQPSNWYTRWLASQVNAELVPQVLARVRQEGALRAADFDSPKPWRGAWWNWKPAKVALEYLYAFGELMITRRVNFQRYYDLTERVLPAWVPLAEPTPEARDRYWVEQAVRALGLCTPRQAGDYTWMKVTPSRPAVAALLQAGLVQLVPVEWVDGQAHDMLVHRDNLPLLEQAAAGALPAARTTCLSPFDSLFWAQDRDEQLWGFQQVLECYKPAPQRLYGYFCLPILHLDRLVGRMDVKLERQARRLRLIALYLEPGVPPDERLAADLAAALRDFLAFHQADDLVIERSAPASFAPQLLKII